MSLAGQLWEFQADLRADVAAAELEERRALRGAMWGHALCTAASALEAQEATARSAVVDAASLRLASLFAAAAGVASNLDLAAEAARRSEAIEAEVASRSLLLRSMRGAAAAADLAQVQDLESAARRAVLAEYNAGAAPLWEAAVRSALSLLDTSAGGRHSEGSLRGSLVVAERRGRWQLALEFCKLRCQWLEEWARLWLMLSWRAWHRWALAAGATMAAEAAERSVLRRRYTPPHLDIVETLEEHAARARRRQEKIAALRALRSAEVERLAYQRTAAEAVVAEHRAAALGRVLSVQDRLCDSVETQRGAVAAEATAAELDRHMAAAAAAPFGAVLEYEADMADHVADRGPLPALPAPSPLLGLRSPIALTALDASPDAHLAPSPPPASRPRALSPVAAAEGGPSSSVYDLPPELSAALAM